MWAPPRRHHYSYAAIPCTGIRCTSLPHATDPGLPRPESEVGVAGAHTGSGVTTLARELGGADLGLKSTTSMPTLVVCRCSADGLIAAQRLAASELTGTPTWTCLGLVWWPMVLAR